MNITYSIPLQGLCVTGLIGSVSLASADITIESAEMVTISAAMPPSGSLKMNFPAPTAHRYSVFGYSGKVNPAPRKLSTPSPTKLSWMRVSLSAQSGKSVFDYYCTARTQGTAAKTNLVCIPPVELGNSMQKTVLRIEGSAQSATGGFLLITEVVPRPVNPSSTLHSFQPAQHENDSVVFTWKTQH